MSLSETCEVNEQNSLFLLKGALNCVIGICTGPAVYRARLLDLGCAGVLFSILRSCSVDAVLRLAATAVVALGCDDPLGDSNLVLSHDDIRLFDGVAGRTTRDADGEEERAASEPPLESYMAMSNLTHASFHALNFLNLMFLRRLNLCWTVPRSLAVVLPRLLPLSKRCRPCKLATALCFKSVITAPSYSEVACAPPIDFSQAAPPNKPTTLPCILPLKKRGHGPRWHLFGHGLRRL